MALRVYNSQTRSKEDFQPLTPGKIQIYVCGVTTYDLCHLGHARAAVVFDTIVRHLRQSFQVTFVRNITDIDDKIINRSNEAGIPWNELTEKYTQKMHEDFARLNILPPDIEPKATDHLKQMIQMIETLIEKNFAYEAEGDVFFGVRKFKEYGKLSKKDLDDLQAGARIGIDEKKADPLDFALWKAAKPDEPSWPSPWGPGRPGWHIECSTMSQQYLGDTLDIHGGGRDLIFPHHENEIAQSECTTGKPFVKYWLHNGFVTIDKQKMSKSIGNFFSIEEVLKKYHPEVVRLFLLSSHYRGPIDYSEANLQDAHTRVERIYQFKARVERLSGSKAAPKECVDAVKELLNRVKEALDDDFNTPKALASIFEVIRALNVFYDQHPEAAKDCGSDAVKAIEKASEVLGIFQLHAKDWLQRSSQSDSVDAQKIDQLIADRAQSRKDKNFTRADEIRDELIAMEIVLEDTPQGTVWRKK